MSDHVAARIYDQEGNLLPFNMKPSRQNELFAEWLRVHDRWGGSHDNH